MTVKERIGRKRYVVFDVSPDLTKEHLIKRFRSVCQGDPPYIIQCVPGKAIIRCSPEGKEEMMRLMTRADPSSVPLATSGTIRTIREKYPELKAAKKPKR